MNDILGGGEIKAESYSVKATRVQTREAYGNGGVLLHFLIRMSRYKNGTDRIPVFALYQQDPREPGGVVPNSA